MSSPSLFAEFQQPLKTSGQSILTKARIAPPAHVAGVKDKGSPYSITERRVLELSPVLGSQPAGGVSHKPGGRLSLLSARPTVTLAILKGTATNSAAWTFFPASMV